MVDNWLSEVGCGYLTFQGDFKVQEDKKHRKTYQALGDSEQKLQFFAARQIACRLLGSRGYLCQKVFIYSVVKFHIISHLSGFTFFLSVRQY